MHQIATKTGNIRSHGGFFEQMNVFGKYWLNRHNDERNMTWEKFDLLLKCYLLPIPEVIHSVSRKKAT